MKNLPTGTVTFLFTDIEGSTTLLVAFSRTKEAVAAQQSLMKHTWPDGASLQVRMCGTIADSVARTYRRAGGR